MPKNCVLAADILIYDDHKLDTILESTNLDEYEFINLPMEQNEHMGVGITPILDTSRTLVKGVQQNCIRELTPCQGCSLSSSHRMATGTGLQKRQP